MERDTIYNKLQQIIAICFAFIYPVFFLDIFPNSFETGKLLLLSLFSILILVIWPVKTIATKEFEYSTSKSNVFIFFFLILAIISSLFATGNKFDSFFFPGTTSFLIGSAIFYLFAETLNKQTKTQVLISFLISAVVLSIFQIVSFTKVFNLIINPLGNQFSHLLIFATTLPLLVFKLFEEKKMWKKAVFGLGGFIVFVALFTTIYSSFVAQETKLKMLDMASGWSIMVDSIKLKPLLGYGPSNFLEAFNKTRPIAFNASQNWDLKFLFNTNTFFTVVSEIGIFAGLSFLIFLASKIKSLSVKKPETGILTLLILLLFIFPIFPSFYPILFLLFAVLTVSSNTQKVKFESKIPAIIITTPILLFVVAVCFFGGKAFLAEYYLGKSLFAVQKNDAKQAYDYIYKAIETNNQIDRYRLTASDINIAIAGSLAGQTTQETQTQIATLVQQAISEGRSAVSLNQTKALNWERLGDTYANLTSFATGSDQFAVQSYSQAIFLDPINPTLRIKLGSVHFLQGRYDDAARSFELAVIAKPDLANSHYNLALAYKELKQLDKAKQQVQITLELLGEESSDYLTALEELKRIEGLTQPDKTPLENQDTNDTGTVN